MTSSTIPNDTQVARILQASDWFVRLSEDALAEPDFAQWLQWCKDPDNLREFQRVCATSEAIECSRSAGERLLQDLEMPATGPVSGQRARKRRPLLATAAVLIGSAVGLLWLWQTSWRTAIPPTQIVSTDGNRTAVLPDGSTLMLAPRSRLSYAFDDTGRHLSLTQGEAYFNVHHDRTRPFVVTAGTLSVTATGTAFDVRLESEHIVTLVQEGSVTVDLADAAAGASARLRLGAGYLANYDPVQRSASVVAIDADRELGWREGRLRFLDRSLGQVVDVVNRYANTRVELGDPRLGELRFTGTVFVESLDDWVGALSGSFPLRAIRPDDRNIVLMPATAR